MNTEREVALVHEDTLLPWVEIPTGRWPLKSRLSASLGFLLGRDIQIYNPRIIDDPILTLNKIMVKGLGRGWAQSTTIAVVDKLRVLAHVIERNNQ